MKIDDEIIYNRTQEKTDIRTAEKEEDKNIREDLLFIQKIVREPYSYLSYVIKLGKGIKSKRLIQIYNWFSEYMTNMIPQYENYNTPYKDHEKLILEFIEELHLQKTSAFLFRKKQNGTEKWRSLPVSHGTQKAIQAFVFIYKAIQAKSSLIIDDLDTSLDYETLQYLIRTFLENTKENPLQMVFSFHNYILLSWELLRKDMLLFTDKKIGTYLYRFTDFEGYENVDPLNYYTNRNIGIYP